VNLNQSLQLHRFGRYDPTCHKAEGLFVKAFWTPEGEVTLALRQVVGQPKLEWQAWGAGQAWLKANWEQAQWLVPQDGPFAGPVHPLVAALDRQLRGLRVVPVPWAFDTLIAYVLQQRVSYAEAARSYALLSQKRRAPGPMSLCMPMQAEELTLSQICSKGVDEKRAATLLRLPPLESHFATSSPSEIEPRLLQVRGLGPWTVQSVLGQGLGRPDSVPTGDLHFPHLVSWKLEGVRFSHDQRMLELLQPYRPARYRALRLLLWRSA
jgi:3-methyladenine DNA glycosylase/8-oxoguanine DNA glycosylase